MFCEGQHRWEVIKDSEITAPEQEEQRCRSQKEKRKRPGWDGEEDNVIYMFEDWGIVYNSQGHLSSFPMPILARHTV